MKLLLQLIVLAGITALVLWVSTLGERRKKMLAEGSARDACTACGEPAPPGATLCPRCGHRLAG